LNNRLISLTILQLAAWAAASLGAQSIPIFKTGIIDCTGREIVPCVYRSTRYIGAGFFLLEEINETDPLKRSEKVHVVNAAGKELRVQVPPGTVLTNVYIPKSKTQIQSKTPDSLPPESIVEIHTSRGCGLCTPDGKTILEPEFQQISGSTLGLYLVYEGGKIAFALDAVTGQRVTDQRKLGLFDFGKVVDGSLNADRMLFIDRTKQPPLFGYLDGDGKVAIEPLFESATSFDSDGFATVYQTDHANNRKSCFRIDSSGHRIPSPDFEGIYKFHNGLAVVRARRSEGSLAFGLINRSFDYVLKPEWAYLDYCFDNVYVARRSKEDALVAIAPTSKLLFKFPANTYTAKESDGLIICYLDEKPGARSMPEKKDITILTADGQTKFVAKGGKEISLGHGLAVIEQNIDSQDKTRTLCTIISKSGVIGDGIEAWWMEPVENDRLVKSAVDLHFSPALWKKDINSRNYQFSNLLSEYDLIGMPRPQVIALLGDENSGNSYRNYLGMCGSVGSWIELKYDDDRVSGWRWASQLYGNTSFEPWVRTNVLIDYDPFPRLGDSLPKKLRPKTASAVR
jgi:hypothetical protein